MANKSITKAVKNKIDAEWRTGQFSQRELADRHKVSVGFVAKITKGIAKDCEHIVSAGVAYKQALVGHSERIVSTIERVVHDKIEKLELLKNYAMDNARQAMETKCSGQFEFKARAEVINKSIEAIEGRKIDTAIQINNDMQKTGSIVLPADDPKWQI